MNRKANTFFYCTTCGARVVNPTDDWKCPYCGAPLELEGGGFFGKRILGEGGTPLISYGDKLYKLEYLNPSGSFKDRGVAATILFLRKNRKCKVIIEDSSGNTGISAAMYAAYLSIPSEIHVPVSISPGKEKLLLSLGARVVKHASREEAHIEAVRRAHNEKACYIGHMTNPVFIAGIERIIDEISLRVLESTENIVLPVASGTLLLGIYRGLIRRRKKNRLPHIWAVQPAEHAYLEGKVSTLRTENAVPSDKTLADALIVDNPARKEQIIEVIKNTQGGVVVIGNLDIRQSLERLYKKGFIVEPSSSVVEAAYELLRKEKIIRGKTLIPLTGSGLKYLEV